MSNRQHQMIENDFVHHPPKAGQADKYIELRAQCRGLAHKIIDLCPDSKERNEAVKKLNEVSFWANAAIARNE